MAVEIAVPFTLDVNGQFAATSDPDVMAQQHVASLVSTDPGERVMLPDYGVPLKRYLFEPGADVVDQQIVLDVRAQMRQWEPGLIITNIQPVFNDDLGTATVDMTWENTPAISAATQQAVIHVGGTVTPD